MFNKNKTGPGVKNPMKNLIGVLKHSTRQDKLGRFFRTNDFHIVTKAHEGSRYMPHQGKQEIARRLSRQTKENTNA